MVLVYFTPRSESPDKEVAQLEDARTATRVYQGYRVPADRTDHPYNHVREPLRSMLIEEWYRERAKWQK